MATPAGPKILMAIGAALLFGGALWYFLGKAFPLGRLPGDIVVEKENFRFYFPVTTSILISVAISVVLYLIRLLGGR